MSYFDSRVLFHTHIAKAAGTSLTAALRELVGPAAVYDLNNDGATQAGGLSPRHRRSIKVLTGHFWYGHYECFFERDAAYVATVRDPIDRFLSLYGFVRTEPTHPYKENFERLGLNGSAEWFFTDAVLSNEMSYSLGVNSGDPVEEIERRYAIVAPHTRVNELIDGLYRAFGRDAVPHFRENAAKESWGSLSRRVEDACRTRSEQDAALCRSVEDNFEKWLSSLPGRLGLC